MQNGIAIWESQAVSFKPNNCIPNMSSCSVMSNSVTPCCSLPGSSAHGIFQARTLEWVSISYSRGSSQPRDRTCDSCISSIVRRILYHQCHLSLGAHSKKSKNLYPHKNLYVKIYISFEGKIKSNQLVLQQING